MSNIVDKGILRKYTEADLRKRDYSCSTFMLYLGLDKVYDLKHHVIVFADDYRKNLREISEEKVLSDDFSFYVRNASVTDPALAPEGHSAVYVLVPVPNNSSTIDWKKEQDGFRNRVVDALEKRAGMQNLRKHIKAEEVISPWHWENERDIFYGATFNLAHTLGQMLHLRPHNEFEELRNCYLVGGGTHPGSGLPTIYESGRVSANMLCSKYRVPFDPPGPLPQT
jgi:phytoene desaturase